VEQASLSLAAFAKRYLSEYSVTKKKAASAHMDGLNLTNHVLPAMGQRLLIHIDRTDIAQLHHAMRDKPTAANRVLALVSHMMTMAEKWGLRPEGSNPCRHVDRYPERKRERFLSTDELARLGAVLADAEAKGAAPPQAVACVRLLLLTGARLGEILTLQWPHVDFDRACLRLPDSKTGAKVVHLNAPALALLADLTRLEGSPYVIFGEREGRPFGGIQKAWQRLRARAGLEDLRLHDLRHSFASVGAADGLSLPIIGALLGHTQAATTQRYAHLAADPLRQATERVGRRIAEAMSAGQAHGDAGEVVPLKPSTRTG
jgi:integrase